VRTARSTHLKQSPDPIDEYIGNRVRMRREMLAMSQQKLGAAIGVTRQHVQKCEAGTRRLSASLLHRITSVLKVPPAFFFEGAPQVRLHRQIAGVPSLDYLSGFPTAVDDFALVKSFLRIKCTKMRRCILALVQAADEEGC
jgi:transcriptional regulator with XRE-family HTH domain